MPQILLIDSDQSLSTILRLNLSRVLNDEILVKDNLTDALPLLELLGDVRLIIAPEMKGQEEVALHLNEYLGANKLDIPVLVFGKDCKNYKYSINIDSILEWERIVASACEVLGLSASHKRTFMAEYVGVDLSYFFNINSTSMGCDVYIRIKKTADEYQYIKRLRSSDHFEREDIENYKKLGLKKFYIPKEHYSNFVNYVTTQLTLKLDDKSVVGEERIRLNSESFDLTLDRIKSLGVDSFTVGLVNESIKSMQASIEESSVLGVFLTGLTKDKMSYAYTRCYLTCLLLQKIIVQFNWCNNLIKEKIIYLSFFHDILLKDEKLLRVKAESEIRTQKLTKEEASLVMEHASRTAQLIEEHDLIPYDVGEFIREHHGRKNGKGFNEELNFSIAPLSMIFIVVENFVIHYLEIENTPTKDQIRKIANELALTYKTGNYALALEALFGVLSTVD